MLTQTSIRGRMDKQNLLWTNNGIVFVLKKEGNSGTYHNLDETSGHYAKIGNNKRRNTV